MEHTKRVACGALSACALATLAVGTDTVSAHSGSTERLTLHVSVRILNFPTASAPGVDIGFDKFPAPFGRGLQYDVFKFIPKTSTTGQAILKFKAYFNTGTVSGVWHATYRFTSPTAGIFKQKVIWTAGTGAFKAVRATGTGTGTETGMHGKITQTVTVTGL
jgi:hypothetical protein